MTAPQEGPPPPVAAESARPSDVDTGFWLWLTALPLMTCGFVVSVLTAPEITATGVIAYPFVGLLAVVVAVVVATFLMLMRSGYRWARTLLTGGGIGSMVNAISGLSHSDPRPAVALVVATTGIVGSVLIAAGTFLLHRADAQAYFVR